MDDGPMSSHGSSDAELLIRNDEFSLLGLAVGLLLAKCKNLPMDKLKFASDSVSFLLLFPLY